MNSKTDIKIGDKFRLLYSGLHDVVTITDRHDTDEGWRWVDEQGCPGWDMDETFEDLNDFERVEAPVTWARLVEIVEEATSTHYTDAFHRIRFIDADELIRLLKAEAAKGTP